MFKLSTTKIHDRLRVGGHRLLDVADEVRLRPRRTDRRRDQLAGRHHEVADQASTSRAACTRTRSARRFPAIIGLLGAFRSNACKPVISSMLTVCVPWFLSSAGASR